MSFDPLFVDLYTKDHPADWSAYGSSGAPWYGAILKVSQGLHYNSDDDSDHRWWLSSNWARLDQTDLIRGAYHYLQIADDGRAQADYFLSCVDRAGGYRKGDLWPIVDVETANNGNPSKDQIIECTSTYAARIAERTGHAPILYGGSFLYDHGVTSQMGCSYLWIARYTATLPVVVHDRIGWGTDKLLAWQYRGDDYSALLRDADSVTYPDEAPGIGKVDISVLTFPGGIAALQAALAA